MEIYVDADFAGNWNQEEAFDDRDTACSRNGYFIMCVGCSIVWKSKLQMEIALSSTESKYTGLSYALWEEIHMMEILKEMQGYGFPITEPNTEVHCRVFEDKSGVDEMA